MGGIKDENSFTRKLKENREIYKNNQHSNVANGANKGFHRSSSTVVPPGLAGQKLNEFSTSGCSDVSEYHLGRQIGHGAYAVVKESIHKNTGERVAIKQYDRYKLMDIQRKKSAMREIKILSRLQHPNVVKLYEAIDTSKYVYLVMEYVSGESLHSYLKA